MPGLSTPSEEPTELIGWKRWDSPRRHLIPDPARGDYHNRSRTPPKRPNLGHRRSTHKYKKVYLIDQEAMKGRSASVGTPTMLSQQFKGTQD